MKHRPWFGPWSTSSVHTDKCTCDRCRHLHVNGCAPKVKP